jgi:hypothetical protein
MVNCFKSVIERGNFELSDMLKKIYVSYVKGEITEKECSELQNLAQGNAKPENDTDVIKKVASLEMRIMKVEELLAKDDVTSPEEAPEGSDTNYPEFESGKWYYGGHKITFEGKNYECIAPEGSVCVWNPKDYPAYWKEID